MSLTSDQLHAIDKLETLAAQKLAELRATVPYIGSAQDPDVRMLENVRLHILNVRESHDNVYCESSVAGSLQYLREVAIRFKFKLKESE